MSDQRTIHGITMRRDSDGGFDVTMPDRWFCASPANDAEGNLEGEVCMLLDHLWNAASAASPPEGKTQAQLTDADARYQQDLWLRGLFARIEKWRDARDGTPSKAEAWSALWKHAHNIGPYWRSRAILAASPPQDERDAARYRWLRGGPDVPQCSIRWPRWEVRNWNGRHWNTLFSDALDTAVDEAMATDAALSHTPAPNKD